MKEKLRKETHGPFNNIASVNENEKQYITAGMFCSVRSWNPVQGNLAYFSA
jgi:hypothetical protein